MKGVSYLRQTFQLRWRIANVIDASKVVTGFFFFSTRFPPVAGLVSSIERGGFVGLPGAGVKFSLSMRIVSVCFVTSGIMRS